MMAEAIIFNEYSLNEINLAIESKICDISKRVEMESYILQTHRAHCLLLYPNALTLLQFAASRTTTIMLKSDGMLLSLGHSRFPFARLSGVPA
jgi:hypothetical protein